MPHLSESKLNQLIDMNQIQQFTNNSKFQTIMKYQILQKVGNGNFSVVYTARNKLTKEIAAVKVMKSHQSIALKQAYFLKSFNHPNVIKLLDFHQDTLSGETKMVLEYLPENTLELYEEKQCGLRQEQVKCILFQSALGLAYLHQKGIIHRDIKPENILIDKNRAEIKLIDLGLAITEDMIGTDYVATRWYRAPENLLGTKEYSSAIDVFSLGCVIVELYLGSALFPGTDNIDQLFRIFNILGEPTLNDWQKGFQCMNNLGFKIGINKKRPKSNEINELVEHLNLSSQNLQNTLQGNNINQKDKLRQKLPSQKLELKDLLKSCSKDLIQIITKMLTLNPKHRVTCKQILLHEYFRDIRTIIPPHIYQRFQQDYYKPQQKPTQHSEHNYDRTKSKTNKTTLSPQKNAFNRSIINDDQRSKAANLIDNHTANYTNYHKTNQMPIVSKLSQNPTQGNNPPARTHRLDYTSKNQSNLITNNKSCDFFNHQDYNSQINKKRIVGKDSTIQIIPTTPQKIISQQQQHIQSTMSLKNSLAFRGFNPIKNTNKLSVRNTLKKLAVNQNPIYPSQSQSKQKNTQFYTKFDKQTIQNIKANEVNSSISLGKLKQLKSNIKEQKEKTTNIEMVRNNKNNNEGSENKSRQMKSEDKRYSHVSIKGHNHFNSNNQNISSKTSQNINYYPSLNQINNKTNNNMTDNMSQYNSACLKIQNLNNSAINSANHVNGNLNNQSITLQRRQRISPFPLHPPHGNMNNNKLIYTNNSILYSNNSNIHNSNNINNSILLNNSQNNSVLMPEHRQQQQRVSTLHDNPNNSIHHNRSNNCNPRQQSIYTGSPLHFDMRIIRKVNSPTTHPYISPTMNKTPTRHHNHMIIANNKSPENHSQKMHLPLNKYQLDTSLVSQRNNTPNYNTSLTAIKSLGNLLSPSSSARENQNKAREDQNRTSREDKHKTQQQLQLIINRPNMASHESNKIRENTYQNSNISHNNNKLEKKSPGKNATQSIMDGNRSNMIMEEHGGKSRIMEGSGGNININLNLSIYENHHHLSNHSNNASFSNV